jgi:hypothetical protein
VWTILAGNAREHNLGEDDNVIIESFRSMMYATASLIALCLLQEVQCQRVVNEAARENRIDASAGKFQAVKSSNLGTAIMMFNGLGVNHLWGTETGGPHRNKSRVRVSCCLCLRSFSNAALSHGRFLHTVPGIEVPPMPRGTCRKSRTLLCCARFPASILVEK